MASNGLTHHDGMYVSGTTTLLGAVTTGASASGVDNTWYGATSGVSLVWDASADGLTITHGSMDGSSFPFQLDCTATSATAGARQGAVYIYLARGSTNTMSSSDGNPDCGFKMKVRNYASSASYIRTRGFDIVAELRSGAAGYYVQGGLLSAKTYSGSTVTDVTGLQIELNHGATGSGTIAGLIINEVSQSSTGTMYGIRIQTANYNIVREYALAIDSTNGSWTNGILFDGTITNVFDFADTDGTNGATTKGSDYSLSNPRAKIAIDVGGTTYYLIGYVTAS